MTPHTTLDDLAAFTLRETRNVPLIEFVAAISAFDRYQASLGISSAATELVRLSRKAGLPNPTIEKFTIDGQRWWSFSQPNRWTPIRAELELPGGQQFDLNQHPMLLATNSAAITETHLTPVEYIPKQWTTAPLPALALVRKQHFDLTQIAADEVAIFATDSAATKDPSGTHHRGRLEINPLHRITGFSLDACQFGKLHRAAEAHATVRATVEICTKSTMPVVCWELRGTIPGEIWVIAHLCHQRPGANDNASGVAGILGTIHNLQRLADCNMLPHRRTIRFISGPEFTGLAAYLKQWSLLGRRPPSAVLNLDMIGQNCELCGGLFRVERSSKPYESDLSAVAEEVTRVVFARAGLSWRPMPFLGYSDNSMFATGQLSAPSIQLCHDHDFYNHTSGDTLERLSIAKFSAAVSVSTTLVALLSMEEDAIGSLRNDVFEKWLNDERVRCLDVASQATASDGAGNWSNDFLAYRNAELDDATNLGGREARTSPCLVTNHEPLNLRGLLDRVPDTVVRHYHTLLAQNKKIYAGLLNSIINLDRGGAILSAIDVASFDMERPFTNQEKGILSELLHIIKSQSTNNGAVVRGE